MIKEFTGNLFDSEADCIGHGVNAYGLMGKGVAVEFKNRYPEMHEHYVHICKNTEPSELTGKAFMWHEPDGKLIANLFSQDKPGPNARYSWALKSIKQALDYVDAMGSDYKSLAIPKIGCGIGGLDWAQMYYYLIDEFEDHPIELHIWSQ